MPRGSSMRCHVTHSHRSLLLIVPDLRRSKQDKEKSGRKPRHCLGAKSQYCATKRAVFMESCFSPLSALGSKIRVHFQNKIPFQQTKTLKMVGCTLQRKSILVSKELTEEQVCLSTIRRAKKIEEKNTHTSNRERGD